MALRADLGAQFVRGRLGVTVGTQDHRRHGGQRSPDRGQQPPGTRVRPVQIVDHQQQRTPRRRLPNRRRRPPRTAGTWPARDRPRRLPGAARRRQPSWPSSWPHIQNGGAPSSSGQLTHAQPNPSSAQPGRARGRQLGLADARLAANQRYPAPPLRRRAHRRTVQLAQLRDPSGQHGPDPARPGRRFQSQFRREACGPAAAGPGWQRAARASRRSAVLDDGPAVKEAPGPGQHRRSAEHHERHVLEAGGASAAGGRGGRGERAGRRAR